MWAYESVFYQIYPLGFCGAPFENDGVLTSRIKKVEEWIPHMKKLNVDAVYFSPVFESDTHGYNSREIIVCLVTLTASANSSCVTFLSFLYCAILVCMKFLPFCFSHSTACGAPIDSETPCAVISGSVIPALLKCIACFTYRSIVYFTLIVKLTLQILLQQHTPSASQAGLS